MSVVILRAGAVEVDCGAVGRVVTVELDILQVRVVGVCLGSSTVLAAVTIVVKRRARLSAI